MLSKEVKIIKNEPDLLITLFLAPIIIIFLILIRPLVHVRIGFLHCDRLGHYTVNTELYYWQKKEIEFEQGRKYIDFLYLPRKISCNKTIEELWRRNLIILPRFFLRPICLIVRKLKFLDSFVGGRSLNSDRDITNVLVKYKPSINFNNEEMKYGFNQLEIMGIPKNSKIVCLNCRDGAYKNDSINFDRHSYRNNNIENFLLCIEELTKRGFFVIRMGLKTESKLKLENNKVLDYSNSKYRTDFMDVFIGSICEFCISTGSGFDGIPTIFRRPILYINFVPYYHIHLEYKNSICIFKHHYLEKEKRFMHPYEIMKHECMYFEDSIKFKTDNIKLVENSPEEIKEATIEMIEQLNNNFSNVKKNEDQQASFWKKFPTALKINKKRYYGSIESQIGSNFLENYKKFK